MPAEKSKFCFSFLFFLTRRRVFPATPCLACAHLNQLGSPRVLIYADAAVLGYHAISPS